MIATSYYLHLPLLHRTFELWQASCNSVEDYSGIRWSMSLQPIVPGVIAKSPFLQEAIPTLSHEQKTIVVAQVTGTWKDGRDTPAIEAAAMGLIDKIDDAAKQEKMQTGYIYLNYAHAGQNVFSDGSDKGEQRKEWLRSISRKYDAEGIFQRCVTGGFKIF